MHYPRMRIAAALLVLCFSSALVSCQRTVARQEAASAAEPSIQAQPLPEARSEGNEPLPLSVRRDELSRRIIDNLLKRVMGRLESPGSIERVVRDIAPIIERAARQPVVERAIAQIARDEGMSFEAARVLWIRQHEADILLESGGRPDVVSVSDAVGVAQWLATTGRGAGLRVDEAASRKLTIRIDDLKRRIAWREYALHPNADTSAPGWPRGLTRENAGQGLGALRAERDSLRAKRRAIDHRYDPEKAVFTQARYLARLYARFPSMDWVYQAYHGGEGGATRTLKRFLGGAWPGSTATAIRRGRGGSRLRFEYLYAATTPHSRPAAFDYLYGRSDDHRHYWWKLRAAEEAIALYRRDQTAFRQAWASYLPGRYLEAAWYPDAHRKGLRLPALPALDIALQSKELLPVTGTAGFMSRVAPLAPPEVRSRYAALQPEAKGLLLLIGDAYRRAGGTDTVVIGDMALTEEYVQQARRRYPPRPPRGPLWPPDVEEKTTPGGGPPEGFDYHTTGLVFDLRKPASSAQRKRLDYVLGYLEDRRILYRTEKTDEKDRSPGWHVVPNPRYAAALTRIAATGKTPPLPGL